MKLLLKAANYKQYFSSIDLSFIKENYPEVHYLYKVLQELHDQYPNTDLSFDEITTYFFAKYPDAKSETYLELIKRASEAEIADDVGAGILGQMKQRQAALKLSEEAYAFSQGRSSLERLHELSTEISQPNEELEDIPGLSLDLDTLLDSAVRIPGLRWRLNFLNVSLGSLRKGDFGFLMKRPETGGTAFLASEVSYMLDQTDGNIVWINNEEQDEKVALRVYQAYFGVTLRELITNAAKYKAIWKEKVGDRFRFYGTEFSSKSSIEKICHKYKPVLIVYDQIDKITGFEADREDLKLGAIYQWARDLCKPYGAALGVTQADGTAEGQKWLNMNHTANSKTSKAAEGDFIFGIGKVHDPNLESSRFISICKNKLIGDEDSLPQFRHGRMETLIDPSIMRYKDIIEYR